MEKLRALAGKYPNVPIVVDHAGVPAARNSEYFGRWAQGITTAAQAESVVMKISGLGMGDHNWTVDSIRPYVLRCIEAFGTERVIFATNWPVDSLFSDYDTIVDAYTEIVADFTVDEQSAMFSKNAEALYEI
jgi:predicted TIM-barrel fold metal-dependent hydrolase